MVLTTWRRHIELECTVLLALRLVPSIEDDLALQGRLVAVALHGLFSEISVFGGRVAGCSDSSSSISVWSPLENDIATAKQLLDC